MHAALKAKGGDILAVSADPIEKLQKGRQGMPDLPCTLASADVTTLKTLHLQHENFGKIGKAMAVPANILIARNGTILWTHYAGVVMDRPDPHAVLEKVQAA